MNKFILHYFTITILAILLIITTQNVSAAELVFKKIITSTDTAQESNNSMTVDVFVNPQSKTLNVVEGNIKFSGNSADKLNVQIENGQSVLPIWPISPQYNLDQKNINFTGGVPNGFNTEGLLFRLILSNPSGINDLEISYAGDAYLNDGKGTKEKISSKPFLIGVNKNIVEEKTVSEKTSTLRYVYAIIILILFVIVFFVYKKRNEKNIEK